MIKKGSDIEFASKASGLSVKVIKMELEKPTELSDNSYLALGGLFLFEMGFI